MSTSIAANSRSHIVDGNLWLAAAGTDLEDAPRSLTDYGLEPEVLATEEHVGRAMLAELDQLARDKEGDLTIALLGGRGAQALHRLLGERARIGDPDGLIRRLNVFTQDALAPMRIENSFSFIRDFERLLGPEFFLQVKSFTTVRTDSPDLEAESMSYVRKLEALGGLDIFFLGLGPELGGASHLAYIKPYSGATAIDVAGIIPISPTIVEHHISKFKAGGSEVNAEDEDECRSATHILTLGPAAILGARRLVQSVVDGDTAPAKCESYRRVMDTPISADAEKQGRQLDANPGLWIRLHPNVRSLVLPNVLG
jgi:6-phosphogluconolactonase/glucosamine-6-phosphate isomerase/deaminase